MPIYQAPIRDISFVLKELVGLKKIQSLPGFEEVTEDLVDAVITEAAKFAENVLAPINLSGDKEGCKWHEDGSVTTPKGFKEAYQEFVNAGWPSLSCEPEYGGQGLPHTLAFFLEEMICSANLSFGLYPGLTRGSYIMLNRHGSKELKDKYLANMVKGVWSGTMCLTEPHCGTDLGLLRTKAEPQANGTYKITGTKIFISSGEHDLTENILHFVIARTPEAPAGIKGISLFLVPKFFVNDDGTLGERNPVMCASIEHKMGIKASATCVMNFDGATGFLVGNLYEGIQNMFTMMNTERLGVGTQGLGVAEVSYQNAVKYARERLQSRSLTGPKEPGKYADPIIVHPDVRRMLLTMKAMVEGCRMMEAWVASHLDTAEHSAKAEERQTADEFVQLMTPIIKAFLTDWGTEIANMGVQVYGGHGYIHEWGMEQFVRDARIAQIYEGTNGIQAMDLIGRKVSTDYGRYLRHFFHPIQAFIDEHQGNPEMAEYIGALAKSLGRLQQATLTIAQKGLADPNEAGAAATDYLKLFGFVSLAYLWCRAVLIAKSKLGQGEDEFYQGKIMTANFYMQKILPFASAHFAVIMAGAKPVMEMPEPLFGSAA